MSIWSKNHEELAKLAQTLQARNVRARRQLGKDGLDTTWPSDRLGASRSKSDSNLSSSGPSLLQRHFHDLSLAGGSEDGSSARLRMDSFSSGDSAISPDFSRGAIVLSPTSILKPSSSRTVRNGGGDAGKMDASFSASPRSPDKKVTFLLRAGSDDNLETLMINGRHNKQQLITPLLNGDNGVDKDIVFRYDTNSCDPSSLKKHSTVDDLRVQKEVEVASTNIRPVPNGTFHDSVCSVVENGDGRYSDFDVYRKDEAPSPTSDAISSCYFNDADGDCHQVTKEHVGSVTDPMDTIRGNSNVAAEHGSAVDGQISIDNVKQSSISVSHKDSVSRISNEVVNKIVSPDSGKSPSVQTKDITGGEKHNYYNSSTTLNISDDLNLLLISLLTNHKKEKILEDVREVKLPQQYDSDSELIPEVFDAANNYTDSCSDEYVNEKEVHYAGSNKCDSDIHSGGSNNDVEYSESLGVVPQQNCSGIEQDPTVLGSRIRGNHESVDAAATQSNTSQPRVVVGSPTATPQRFARPSPTVSLSSSTTADEPGVVDPSTILPDPLKSSSSPSISVSPPTMANAMGVVDPPTILPDPLKSSSSPSISVSPPTMANAMGVVDPPTILPYSLTTSYPSTSVLSPTTGVFSSPCPPSPPPPPIVCQTQTYTASVTSTHGSSIPSIVLSLSSTSNVTLVNTPVSVTISSLVADCSQHQLFPISSSTNTTFPRQNGDDFKENVQTQRATQFVFGPQRDRMGTVSAARIVTEAYNISYRTQPQIGQPTNSVINLNPNISEFPTTCTTELVSSMRNSIPSPFTQPLSSSTTIHNSLAFHSVAPIPPYGLENAVYSMNPCHSPSRLSPSFLGISDARHFASSPFGNTMASPLHTPTHQYNTNVFSPIPAAHVAPSAYTPPVLLPHQNNYYFRPVLGLSQPLLSYQSSQFNAPHDFANGGLGHSFSPVFAPPPQYVFNRGEQEMMNSHFDQIQIVPNHNNNSQTGINHDLQNNEVSLESNAMVGEPPVNNVRHHHDGFIPSQSASSQPGNRECEVSTTQNSGPILSDTVTETSQACHDHTPFPCQSRPASHLSQSNVADLRAPSSSESPNASFSAQVCDKTMKSLDANSSPLLMVNSDALSNLCTSASTDGEKCDNSIVNGSDKMGFVERKNSGLSALQIQQNKTVQNGVHATAGVAVQCLSNSTSSNDLLKDSVSQTEPAAPNKPNSPVYYHGAFPGNIDIHVHPTINIPTSQTQNDTPVNKSRSSHRKHKSSRRSADNTVSSNNNYTDTSSYMSSSFSDDASRQRHIDRNNNRTVGSSNSKSDSLASIDFPDVIKKIEKLVQSFQLKEFLESNISEIPIEKRKGISFARSRNGLNEMFAVTNSTQSSLSVRSNKSITSTSSRTSVVETVYSDSNALALLQTLKIVQNLSHSETGGNKKKKGRNGFHGEQFHQLLEILDHFESRLSSQQLKDVKHDLHSLARNLKRQMKTNRLAVRDEIENRSKLFTSERFTKGTTTDLQVEDARTDSTSNPSSANGSSKHDEYRRTIAQRLSPLTDSGSKSKGDTVTSLSTKINGNLASAISSHNDVNINREQKKCLDTQNTPVNHRTDGLHHFPNLELPVTPSACTAPQQILNLNREVSPNHPFVQMIRFMSEESIKPLSRHEDLTIINSGQPEISTVVSSSSDDDSNSKMAVTINNNGSIVNEGLNIESANRPNEEKTKSINYGNACTTSPSNSTHGSQKCYQNGQTLENSDHSNGINEEISFIACAKPASFNNSDLLCVHGEHFETRCNVTYRNHHDPNNDITDTKHDIMPSIITSVNQSPSLSNASFVVTPQSSSMISSEILDVPPLVVFSPELVSAFTPIHPAPINDIPEFASKSAAQEVSSAEVTGSPGSDVTDRDVPDPVVAEMESDSHHTFQMDREFDKHLADMKPHVLKLPHKADRQKCAVWIKKLCEPQGSSISARKTRNLYAQLMLQMLKKGVMSSPFDLKPSDGPLQPLPSYVSVYFDDPLNGFEQAERIPDWVEGELGETLGSSSGLPRSLGNPAATSTWVSGIADLIERPHSSMGHTLDKDPSLSPIRHNDHKGRSNRYSVDDMSIEVKRTPSPPRHRPMKSLRSPDREKRQLPDVKAKGSRDEGSSRPHHHQHPHQQQQQQHHHHHDYPLTNETDWNKPYNNMSMASSVSLPKGTTFYDDLPSYHKPTDREVAVRTKMIEAKFHEEKLKLQQKHDASVQKILDRKNAEIEDVKNHYRSKSKDIEDANCKMEKKVQTLLKEIEYVTQNKDKQIAELKKLNEESNETRRNEFEKRLHDVMAEFDQEKFDMQKQHTQNIQEILDDTNSRLQRMETEYSHQTTTTTNVIKELESRVQHLMTEVDSTLNQRSAVEKEKNEALSRLEKLMEEHERLKEKSLHVERQHHATTETQEHNLRSLKNKTEASLEFLKQENAIAVGKAADTIKELEDKIDQLKKAVKETEEQRHRQIRELEQVHQQDKLHAENLHDKQVRNMKKEMEQQDSDWGKKMSKAEKTIKEREEEMAKLKEQKQQQAVQAEQSLEEFKLQVEKNQARIYDEMKQQMDQVEGDLTKSKQAREKQVKEFTRQMEDMGFKHQHEIAEIKMNGEAEKSQLMREFHVQKEFIISEHDKEVDNLKDVHRTEVQALEARLKERHDKAEKSSLDSERIIRELREELVQANQLRKQQLVELGLLREEEKQKVHRDHEAELARQRTELEQHRLELQKSHSVEMEAVLEKTNERLKSIEKEYADRGSKSAESIAELQNVVLQLRGDIKKSRENSDEKLAELKHQYEEEKQNLRKHYSQNLSTIQKEVEANRNRARNLERQLQTEESDNEEKITHLQLQNEERIRGLMSADLKKELESTITSLKAQVSSLQQRSLMLQEELDAKNRNSLGPFGTRTSSPIKSSV